MAAAFIDGRPVALPEAIGEAASLLQEARYPIIAGLGADIQAVRAAIRLAEALACPFDHMASGVALNILSVLRDSGWMSVSPDEGRRLADTVLVVGAIPKCDWPAALAALPPPGKVRLAVTVGARGFPGRLAKLGYATESIAADPPALPGILAALRARAAGRPASSSQRIDRAAAALKDAAFGLAVWRPASLDRLATEMLAGLLQDLNAETRFSAAPLPAPHNGMGAAMAAGWLTGFPTRTGFGRGYPEHDPWRFDARRMIAAGEADAAVWLSALATEQPDWNGSVDLVALVALGTRLAGTPRVRIEVGVPGLDHDGVLLSAETGSLAHVAATAASDRPRADAVLQGILQSLPERRP